MEKNEQKRKLSISDKENEGLPRVRCFNTKGYYDPALPYDNQYIEAKIQAFHKYRERQKPLSILEAIVTDKQLQQQKNMILHHCRLLNSQPPLRERRVNIQEPMTTKWESQTNHYEVQKRQRTGQSQASDRIVNHLKKSYLQKKQRIFCKNNKNDKPILSIALRINTEGLAQRRYTHSSLSMKRSIQSRNSNILRIDDEAL